MGLQCSSCVWGEGSVHARMRVHTVRGQPQVSILVLQFV